VVINRDYQKGQLSSLIAGINDTPQETEAILVCLADAPFLTKDVVENIIRKFRETNSPIIVPVLNEERGHPTLFSRALFNELLNAPEQEGARHVLYSNEDQALELKTAERGILISIDTPADYRFHFGVDP
jgi:CTP:molybdopterin cytidylyltransferase MocA